jgi:arylsulfatase A-like enzyme
LRDAGYATYAVSALGNVSTSLGFASGFDSFTDLYKDPTLYGVREVSTSEDWKLSFEQELKLVLPLGQDVCQRALAHVDDRPRGMPFFLLLWTIDPHDPYLPPAEFLEFTNPTYRGFVDGRWPTVRKAKKPEDVQHVVNLYDGEVAYADSCLGLFVDELKQRNLYENTLLIVTSDHGEALGEHGDFSHGYLPYDIIVRVPLVIKFPRDHFASSQVTSMVSLLDIMPTVLDYLGIGPAALSSSFTQGCALMPVLQRDEEVHHHVFFETRSSQATPALHGIRDARWKYIRLHRAEHARSAGARDLLRVSTLKKLATSPLFYARRYARRHHEMLFDLRTDPGEEVNVLDDRPDKSAGVSLRLDNWLATSRDLARLLASGETEDARNLADEATLRQLRGLGYID